MVTTVYKLSKLIPSLKNIDRLNGYYLKIIGNYNGDGYIISMRSLSYCNLKLSKIGVKEASRSYIIIPYTNWSSLIKTGIPFPASAHLVIKN